MSSETPTGTEVTDEVVDKLKEGCTYDDLVDIGYSRYAARKLVQEKLPSNGYTVKQRRANSVGKKEFKIVEDESEEFAHNFTPRLQGRAAQTKTKEMNNYLAHLEDKIEEIYEDFDGLPSEKEIARKPGRMDLVIPRMDDHFGALDHDEHGNVIYDFDTCEDRVRKHIDYAIEVKRNREEMGEEYEGVHLVLGGDIVTNEDIYQGQAHDIQDTADVQMARATKTYKDVIKKLAEEFDYVQVACNAGNHGEERTGGQSGQKNLDRFIYLNLEMMIAETDYNNISFVYSDTANYVNFDIRGHDAHLRHGQNVSGHIGTARPESDWRGYLIKHDFDIAFRGHYHSYRLEHVNGRPVMLCPSIKPSDEYEEQLAYFSKPMAVVMGASDDNPMEWHEYIKFDE